MFRGIMKASKGFYSQKIILMPSLRSLLITFLIKTEKAAVLYWGPFCTLGIRIFSEFALSYQIDLAKPNENVGVTQTSERASIVKK